MPRNEIITPAIGTYFVERNHLYRMLGVTEDGRLRVENCETLYDCILEKDFVLKRENRVRPSREEDNG